VSSFKYKCLFGVAAVALAVPAVVGSALADPQLDAVLQRLDKLEKENAKLKNEIKAIETKTTKMPMSTASVGANKTGPTASGFVQVAMPKASYGAGTAAENINYTNYKDGGPEDDDWYFRHKPGSGLTFLTPNGQITAYGQLDVSLDFTTKGIENMVTPNVPFAATNPSAIGGGGLPVGGHNLGWMPALSTNLSYVGIRGYQNIGGFGLKDDSGLKFVYQLETQIDVTATAGISDSGSNESAAVKGGLTSRNSFVGFADDQWGSIKAGKTDAPYKNSTAMMNPFAGMLGDYSVIMGNTGGDNRVEFATRLDHSIWYESPNIKIANGNFSFAALFSPGQNRASNSDNIAAGESDCAGGNDPYSGGFGSCSDGAFNNAYSVSATYQTKIDSVGILVTSAYERHQNVNRSSDFLAIYGGVITPSLILTPAGLNGAQLSQYNQDTADEDAFKVGVQVKLPTGTTVSGIYETMHRYVPADLQFQNERQRQGTWLALTQDVTERDNINFGWAHAFKTPGDPCQHNDCTLQTSDGMGVYAPNANQSDMITAAWKHTIAQGWLWYVDYAATINGPSAHYDLGAGGRGVTTDCHDAFSQLGGVGSAPRTWTGCLVQGVSTGIRYNF
jgi:predicted porin